MAAAYYILMDLDSGNLVASYDSREEAFATVLEAYERYGTAGVEDLGLSEEVEGGGGTLVGIGDELLRCAQATVPERVSG